MHWDAGGQIFSPERKRDPIFLVEKLFFPVFVSFPTLWNRFFENFYGKSSTFSVSRVTIKTAYTGAVRSRSPPDAPGVLWCEAGGSGFPRGTRIPKVSWVPRSGMRPACLPVRAQVGKPVARGLTGWDEAGKKEIEILLYLFFLLLDQQAMPLLLINNALCRRPYGRRPYGTSLSWVLWFVRCL